MVPHIMFGFCEKFVRCEKCDRCVVKKTGKEKNRFGKNINRGEQIEERTRDEDECAPRPSASTPPTQHNIFRHAGHYRNFRGKITGATRFRRYGGETCPTARTLTCSSGGGW